MTNQVPSKVGIHGWSGAGRVIHVLKYCICIQPWRVHGCILSLVRLSVNLGTFQILVRELFRTNDKYHT